MNDSIRSTRAVINLNAIAHNISAIQKKIGRAELMAVVKADGYGHGAVEVSKAALRNGADCLAVAIPGEGKALRDGGIAAPILSFGGFLPEEATQIIDARLEQSISTLGMANSLDKAARDVGVSATVHIKIDTGMGRLGVLPCDAKAFVEKVIELKNLTVKGIFSHFSTADEADPSFARRQIREFDGLVRELDHAGIKISRKHMANSGGILDFPEAYYDMVRPGIMIYGLYPSKDSSRSVSILI